MYPIVYIIGLLFILELGIFIDRILFQLLLVPIIKAVELITDLFKDLDQGIIDYIKKRMQKDMMDVHSCCG